MVRTSHRRKTRDAGGHCVARSCCCRPWVPLSTSPGRLRFPSPSVRCRTIDDPSSARTPLGAGTVWTMDASLAGGRGRVKLPRWVLAPLRRPRPRVGPCCLMAVVAKPRFRTTRSVARPMQMSWSREPIMSRRTNGGSASRRGAGKAPPLARGTVRRLRATIKAKEAQVARLLAELDEARALLSGTVRRRPT